MARDKERRSGSRGRRSIPRRVTATKQESEASVEADVVLPHAAVALGLIAHADDRGLIFIAADERQAEEIGRVVERFAPALEATVFPPWDCLPFDRVSPSRDSMGRRVAVVQRLAAASRSPRLVITTIEAAMQRTPPAGRLAEARFDIRHDEPVDVSELRVCSERYGYLLADRVDQPGDVDFHGQVVEIFPPDAAAPIRIEVDGDRIVGISSFDPVTQRSLASLPSASFGPASEIVPDRDDTAPVWVAGMEHRLAEFYSDPLPSLFDHLPDAVLVMASASEARRQAFLERLADAKAAQELVGPGVQVRRLPDWTRLYVDGPAWDAIKAKHEEHDVADDNLGSVPTFADAAKPLTRFRAFLVEAFGNGQRVVLAGVPRDLSVLTRHVAQHGGPSPVPASDWAAVAAAAPGTFLSMDLDLDEGIFDKGQGIVLVAAADVLGTRVHHATGPQVGARALMAQLPMKIGDTVIHEDHGIGVLRALETVEIEGEVRDAVRIGYHDDASLLVPAEDLDRVWRYGSEEEAVSLDRLHTDAWAKRRIEVDRAVRETATRLVEIAEERRACVAPKLVAPAERFARFVARFAYPLTADQSRAVAAVTDDLASGHPMDRLVCGDVGFGKTEVALRATAVALMAGKQVALVAPTTVLARQHLETFRKRFAGLGFEIAGLSRLESGAEANAVKNGLADGSIHMVIGTHAVAGAGVNFADLGLVIIDEEHKFGAKLKAGLRALASAGHVLTLTATPIPRTLQMALVGVQTVSVIATPPVRRRPIRTSVAAFDPAAVRTALMHEQARGGQCFLIVPRIEDIKTMRERLTEIVPELEVLVAHGDLPAEETDRAMVDFARGQGDVLLATNIVESGLDVPRANTILVWDAGRFGLAQLHQLRGRVGRGRAQGIAYLLTQPDAPLSEATRARLTVLQSFDRLGAGFAISARDLDLRGAGDLIGDEQAGHVRLIGLELYQSLLARAVRNAKGEPVDDAAPPELRVGQVGRIPDSYVAEPDLRIEIYARLSRLTSGKAIRAFRVEVEDRFGSLPPEVETLFVRARLRSACRRLEAASISAGPLAVALTVRPGGMPRCRDLARVRADIEVKGSKLLWNSPAGLEDGPLARAETLVELMEEARPAAA